MEQSLSHSFLRKECFIYGNLGVIALHCLHAGGTTISPRQVAQFVNLAPAVFWQHGVGEPVEPGRMVLAPGLIALGFSMFCWGFFGPGAWQTAGNAIFALSLIYLLAALVGVYVNFTRKGKD